MENTDFQQPKSNKGLTILLIVVILALGAAIIVLSTKLSQVKNDSSQAQTLLEDQKQSLKKELTDMIGQYDALKGNNDSMNQKISGQQDKIKRLLNEHASNVQLINKYKKELATLREVLRSYIVQVDSLNTRNQQLSQENVQVKSNLSEARNENEKLNQEKTNLSSQVQKAAVITAGNITVTPLNKRAKEETKLKNILKLKVCLTLRENTIAKAGTKEVYIRILRSNGEVMAYSQSDVFEYRGQSIVYSAKRQVEYDNKDIDLCIFWDNNNQLAIGDYSVEIYTDGNQIGSSRFTIKK
ncbi:MAG: hypothetical protein Q8928_00795 [Bacteroidota bacterium]|nr:hypothetical protein [Bacteroidota bacterium]